MPVYENIWLRVNRVLNGVEKKVNKIQLKPVRVKGGGSVIDEHKARQT